MKKNLWWIILAVLILISLVFGGGMMAGGWGGYAGHMGGWGYPGYGGHMGGWGFSPFGWFGMGLGMLLMWGLPLALLVLAALGVASLFKGGSRSTSTPAAQAACPHCAKSVQADWQNCPYCGASLK